MVISHSEGFFRSHCHESITSWCPMCYLRRNQWLGDPFHFFRTQTWSRFVRKTCCCIPNSFSAQFKTCELNWHLISFDEVSLQKSLLFWMLRPPFWGSQGPKGNPGVPKGPCCYSRRLSWRAAKVIKRGSRQKWRSAAAPLLQAAKPTIKILQAEAHVW